MQGYFAVTTWLWTVVIAMEALLTVYRKSAKAFKMLHKHQQLVWVLALSVIATLPSRKVYLTENNYCGIENGPLLEHARSELPYVILGSLCFVFCLGAYVAIIRHMWKFSPHSTTVLIAKVSEAEREEVVERRNVCRQRNW
jgi:hypothetical protein